MLERYAKMHPLDFQILNSINQILKCINPSNGDYKWVAKVNELNRKFQY